MLPGVHHFAERREAGPGKKSLCWRPGRRGSDTCSGDSGGPLLVDGAVAGVTSGGIGTQSCPSVLSYDTNVVRYRGWIEDVLQQQAR